MFFKNFDYTQSALKDIENIYRVFVTPKDELDWDRLVSLMASFLNQMIEANANVTEGSPCVFTSIQKPPISLQDYIRRMRFLIKDETIYIQALIFFDRYVTLNPLPGITPFNVHRLLAAALMLANKVNDEGTVYDSSDQARVLGFSDAQEVNRLELCFLVALGIISLGTACKTDIYPENLSRYQPTNIGVDEEMNRGLLISPEEYKDCLLRLLTLELEIQTMEANGPRPR